MKLSKRQKTILLGTILGDGYLQKTGSKNARLRLEHSLKQQAYMYWKYSQLENLFQSKPKLLKRIHPKSKRTYEYVRLQSHSSPVLGKLRQQFYDEDGEKILPENMDAVLKSPLTIAVWYMDDGYYDKRDKSAHIYLQRLDNSELERLAKAFHRQHNIQPKWYCRTDRKGCQLNFTGIEKQKLMVLINPYLIDEMRYKTPLDPVTTESENHSEN